jgi:hypothetical protein
MMKNLLLFEAILVVGLIIQPHNSLHPQLLEDRHVIMRCKRSILHIAALYPVFVHRLVGRTAKGDKFLRNDPIQVTILNFLVMLVLSQVKGLIVKPAQLDCVLQSSKAIE